MATASMVIGHCCGLLLLLMIRDSHVRPKSDLARFIRLKVISDVLGLQVVLGKGHRDNIGLPQLKLLLRSSRGSICWYKGRRST